MQLVSHTCALRTFCGPDWDHFVVVHELFSVDVGSFRFSGQTDGVDYFIFELLPRWRRIAFQRAHADRKRRGHAECCDRVGFDICYRKPRLGSFLCQVAIVSCVTELTALPRKLIYLLIEYFDLNEHICLPTGSESWLLTWQAYTFFPHPRCTRLLFYACVRPVSKYSIFTIISSVQFTKTMSV